MKIYFGKLDPSESTQGFVKNNSLYEYVVEFGDYQLDDLVIKDAVGRFVPISIECLKELSIVIDNIVSANEYLDTADTIMANMTDPDFSVCI